MSKEELDRIIAEFASAPPLPTDDVAGWRRLYDHPDPRYATADDVRVEPVVAGAVKGEWLIPSAAGKAVVLYFHGGGYCFRSPATHRHMVAELARLADARAFSLDYRLAPEHSFPAAVDDALACVVWLYAQGVEAKDLVLAGDSAGGGLAFASLLNLRDRDEAMPAGAIGLTPWVDLAMSDETLARYAADDPKNSPDDLVRLARMYLQGADGRDPLASPLFADLSRLPPLCVLAAPRDRLFGEAKAFAAAARAHRVEVTLGIWDGMIHVWPIHWQRLGEGRDALERMAEFVRERTGGSEHLG